ncbi:MAG: DnaK suppressor protein [Salibacteraceae bacterium]|jgi:DnaK suppressor protein
MDKAILKQKIISELVETKLRIVELKELTKRISPENAIGRISRMDAINNKTINERTLAKWSLNFKN